MKKIWAGISEQTISVASLMKALYCGYQRKMRVEVLEQTEQMGLWVKLRAEIPEQTAMFGCSNKDLWVLQENCSKVSGPTKFMASLRESFIVSFKGSCWAERDIYGTSQGNPGANGDWDVQYQKKLSSEMRERTFIAHWLQIFTFDLCQLCEFELYLSHLWER